MASFKPWSTGLIPDGFNPLDKANQPTLVADPSAVPRAPGTGDNVLPSYFHVPRDLALLGALGSKVTPQQFGAYADGIHDDTAALVTALSSGKTVYLPAGTYLYSSGLTVTGVLCGDGMASILKPTSAVTVALTARTKSHLRDFALDGSLTTGAVGLRLWDTRYTAPANVHMHAERLRVHDFQGVGAVGIDPSISNSSLFDHIQADSCTVNVFISSAYASMPTTTTFRKCYFNYAKDDGTQHGGQAVVVQQGYSIVFDGCVFESNRREGLLVDCHTGDLTDLLVTGNCWFEDNWYVASEGLRDTGEVRTAQYHLTCKMATESRTVRPVIDSAYFAVSDTTCKGMHLIDCAGFRVGAGVQRSNITGAAHKIEKVVTGYGCYGSIDPNVNHGLADFDVVAPAYVKVGYITADPDLVESELHDAWADWTPTITVDSGLWTGGVTTLAKYKRVGRTMTVSINISGTGAIDGGAPAPANVLISIPDTWKLTVGNRFSTGLIFGPTSYEPALVEAGGGETRLSVGKFVFGGERFTGLHMIAFTMTFEVEPV